ncbi:prolyl aminopeptidase [Reinekea forsetii]|nr:prolyl aminopeptidase [Reinekea forsetii]
MKALFPEIRPYMTTMLPVSDGHQLYVECSGTQSGIPVLVIHGGPGAGCSDKMRRFFDPERYNIIVFDQRGAGRSTPHASIEHNTPSHILDDIEVLRKHLGISRWVLFGGSFGATLALLYAQHFSKHVCGLILRGVFLGRQQDLDWLYKNGAGRFFPEEWQLFLEPLQSNVKANVIDQYYQILQGDNDLARVAAAKAWARWEAANSSFRPNQSSKEYFTATHVALALSCISSHYFKNKCFLDENQILDNIAKIADIPGHIVHGRYDMVCPPEQAYILSEHWPLAKLNIVREGGHSAFDNAMLDALICVTNDFAKQLGAPETEA